MEGSTIFVKPKSGLIVRDPLTFRPIPSGGAHVTKTNYWLRRVKCGDVVLVDELFVTPEPIAVVSEPKPTLKIPKKNTRKKFAGVDTNENSEMKKGD